MLTLAGALLASLPALFFLAQEELAPEEDTGGVFMVGNAPRYANLAYSDYYLSEVVDIWKQIPEFSHSWQVIQPGSNFGGITLYPWEERERTQQPLSARLHRGQVVQQGGP